MTNAPERIWIEDEFGDGDDDQWTYGTWDVRNYRGYVVEYIRADLALPAVQPDTAPAGNLTARGNAATWALYDANLTRTGALRPAHVNETPKSEHDARDVLTPATKGGDA